MAEHAVNRRPKKPKLGQNFLVSPTAPLAIVNALGNISEATVLEIGPGKGAITRLLASRARHLIAVELDPLLATALEEATTEWSRAKVEILHQDVLTVDLSQLAHRFSGRLVVVGNLPYYITSDILLHLFAHHASIEQCMLMVQREVADRLVARPGSREYGLLSATAQMYADVETILTLPPNAFSPPPEVYSTLFRLRMQPRFAELEVDAQPFLGFLRQSFAQKRKTLLNNLRAAGFDGTDIQRCLSECGIDLRIRSEAVPLEQMACAFRRLHAKKLSSRVE
jgi:16S rRNA (adenine1518-N6/adenine1519-N6)-dimethyltransferase